MNYLTNYYKNLSEQLQEKVNLLESYLHQLNEELESETIIQGPGAGAGAGTGTTTTNQTNTNSALNAFLQAWGTSDPSYDYNGDGVVDGNDLGIFLAGMLNRGGNVPTTMASTALPGTPEQVAGTPTKRMKAINQPGLGTETAPRFNTARTMSGAPKAPVNPELDARTGMPLSYDYSTGDYVPPSGGGGDNRGGNGGGTKKPPSGGGNGGGTKKPPSGGGDDTTPPTMPPRRAKVPAPITSPSPTSETGSIGFYDTTMSDIGEPAIVRGQTPYWMSNRTTDVDTSFRGMQRKRRG